MEKKDIELGQIVVVDKNWWEPYGAIHEVVQTMYGDTKLRCLTGKHEGHEQAFSNGYFHLATVEELIQHGITPPLELHEGHDITDMLKPGTKVSCDSTIPGIKAPKKDQPYSGEVVGVSFISVISGKPRYLNAVKFDGIEPILSLTPSYLKEIT